jgi:predicted RNA-binding protein with RPS1 domain
MSTGENPSSETPSSQEPSAPVAQAAPAATVVGKGPLAARGLGIAKPSSPTVDLEKLQAQQNQGAKSGDQGKPSGNKKSRSAPRPKLAGESRETSTAVAAVRSDEPSSGYSTADESEVVARPRPTGPRGKIAVPNRRHGLDDDLMAEFEAEIGGEELDSLLGQAAGMATRREPIIEGTRVSSVVLKIQGDIVFVSLGGPDEATVPFEQFETEPQVGAHIEVIVRGFNSADGLYACSLPHGAIEVSDWEDLQEGSVVEATITATNTGGLEAKVGGVIGFIPISQISQYRVEDTSEYVGQKLLCVVTEANQRRGNLVLSHRAILDRERETKRKEQLEKIEAGDLLEGTVRSVKDFGAFIDLGGLDGMIHVSKLSWERIKHPSEVLEVGQKVKVRIDKVDKATGKISLTYRDLLENPWDLAEAQFAPGSIHKGTVSKTAVFGCFVKLGAGVEGLVHISELATHRVSNVESFVKEGQEVEVKVLSFNRDDQKISLSIKQVHHNAAEPAKAEEEEDTPRPEVAIKPQHGGPLRGGNNQDTGGERFGLRW